MIIVNQCQWPHKSLIGGGEGRGGLLAVGFDRTLSFFVGERARRGQDNETLCNVS